MTLHARSVYRDLQNRLQSVGCTLFYTADVSIRLNGRPCVGSICRIVPKQPEVLVREPTALNFDVALQEFAALVYYRLVVNILCRSNDLALSTTKPTTVKDIFCSLKTRRVEAAQKIDQTHIYIFESLRKSESLRVCIIQIYVLFKAMCINVAVDSCPLLQFRPIGLLLRARDVTTCGFTWALVQGSRIGPYF